MANKTNCLQKPRGFRFGLHGRGYRDLSPNYKREVFRSSFQWKLGSFEASKVIAKKKTNLDKNYTRSFIQAKFGYFTFTFEP